jgi:hypothetical protein
MEPPKESLPAAAITGVIERFRRWDRLWSAFQTQHATWTAGIGAAEPAYTLPDVIIDSLARTKILTPDEADSEHAFRRMCQDYSGTTVGAWNSQPVDYPPLTEVPANFGVSDELIKKLNWAKFVAPAAIQAQLKELQGKSAAARHQMIGYAGKITFADQYQHELADLRTAWCGLKVGPSFPLQASTGDQPAVASHVFGKAHFEKLDDASSRFIEDATTFMRRWQLCSLVTWDLPFPQGPLENIPLVAARTALGPDGAVSIFPTYYDIPSHADLRGDIREQQRRVAKDNSILMPHPLTDIAARGQSASTSENAFRMWLIETTLRRRYPARHGIVTKLIRAFVELFKFQEDRAHKIRLIYLPYLS